MTLSAEYEDELRCRAFQAERAEAAFLQYNQRTATCGCADERDLYTIAVALVQQLSEGRNDVPALLSEVARLRSRVRELEPLASGVEYGIRGQYAEGEPVEVVDLTTDLVECVDRWNRYCEMWSGIEVVCRTVGARHGEVRYGEWEPVEVGEM